MVSRGELAVSGIGTVLTRKDEVRLKGRTRSTVVGYHGFLSDGVSGLEEPICKIAANFNSLYGVAVPTRSLSRLRRGLMVSRTYNINRAMHPRVIGLVLLLGVRSLSCKRSKIRLVAIRELVSVFGGSVLPIVCRRNSLKTSNSLTPLTRLDLPLVNVKRIICGKRIHRSSRM